MPSELAYSGSTSAVPELVKEPITGDSSTTTNDDTLPVQHSSEPSSTTTITAADTTATADSTDDVQPKEAQEQQVCALKSFPKFNVYQRLFQWRS
jgi:hypothetical protein